MTKDWVRDIQEMHVHFGHTARHREFTDEEREAFLQFRIAFLQEELDELKANHDDPEEVVDALIDLCVVAIGTLDAYQVDAHKAWDEVLQANMKKHPGVKPERPNPLKLPDLMKPADWEPPCHVGNHGKFPKRG